MVEITYQMILSTLQTVGLLVGIFYYFTTRAHNFVSPFLLDEFFPCFIWIHDEIVGLYFGEVLVYFLMVGVSC